MKICFQREIEIERRGENLPGRLRVAARRGVTLVELMIAMLILAIVCLSWFEILSIQSAKREALRREGVERLAGMMEAFLASFNLPNGVSDDTLNNIGDFQPGDAVFYNPSALVSGNGYIFKRLLSSSSETEKIFPIFSDDEIKDGSLGSTSPGYRLHIGKLGDGSNRTDVMDFELSKDGQSSVSCLMPGDSTILVGDLFERAGEIDEINPPKRICRFKLFLR